MWLIMIRITFLWSIIFKPSQNDFNILGKNCQYMGLDFKTLNNNNNNNFL